MELETRIVLAIKKSIEAGSPDIIIKVIDSIPGLKPVDKNRLYRQAAVLYKKYRYAEFKPNNTEIKKLVSGTHRIMENRNRRERVSRLRADMRDRREAGQVFWLCSTHVNAADDHRDWQGKIYVDRFWRSVLEGSQDKDSVAAYIKNHDIVSVQDIIGEPVYMITRPYCRHRMIPVQIDEVLHSSVNNIKRNHPESVSGGKRGDSRARYYKLRGKIHTALGMTGAARIDSKRAQR